jgi:hypothetical protein
MIDRLKKLMEKNGVQNIKKPDKLKELEEKLDELAGKPAPGFSDTERIEALEAAILEMAEVMANG